MKSDLNVDAGNMVVVGLEDCGLLSFGSQINAGHIDIKKNPLCEQQQVCFLPE
jgi:hypothetical protein